MFGGFVWDENDFGKGLLHLSFADSALKLSEYPRRKKQEDVQQKWYLIKLSLEKQKTQSSEFCLAVNIEAFPIQIF